MSAAGEDADAIDQKLEEQYTQGMGLKLSGAPRRHMGLGFQKEEPPKPDSSTSCEPSQPEEPVKDSTESQASSYTESNEADAKPDTSEPDNSDRHQPKYARMGFVKSS